jgi:hypothetical protein
MRAWEMRAWEMRAEGGCGRPSSLGDEGLDTPLGACTLAPPREPVTLGVLASGAEQTALLRRSRMADVLEVSRLPGWRTDLDILGLDDEDLEEEEWEEEDWDEDDEEDWEDDEEWEDDDLDEDWEDDEEWEDDAEEEEEEF